MALHLESILPRDITKEEYLEIGKTAIQTALDVYQPIDTLSHFRAEMIDRSTGDLIGLYVVSVYKDEARKMNVILDEDITLPSKDSIKLQLMRQMGETSFSTQIFNAVIPGTDYPPFWIETVNRFTAHPHLEGKNVEGTVNFFPNRLTCYPDMAALNRAYGWPAEITDPKFRELGITSVGYSDNFLAMIEGYPKLFGTVVSAREIRTSVGSLDMEFVSAKVRTALGVIPVPINKDLFNIEAIEPGNALDMSGTIALDFSQRTEFMPLRWK